MKGRKRAMKRKKMAKGNDTEQPSGSRDENTRSVPSAVKLKQMIGTSPAYRMLTPEEIELLRKSKREIDQVVGEILEKKRDT